MAFKKSDKVSKEKINTISEKLEKIKAYRKQWKKINRERVNKNRRDYYWANHEKILKYQHEYRHRDIKKWLEYNARYLRAWRLKNPDYISPKEKMRKMQENYGIRARGKYAKIN